MAETFNGLVNIHNYIENKKRLHSLMPKFIEILAYNVISTEPETPSNIPSSYEIPDKIKHNGLEKYRSLVDDYGNYYAICENSFKALEHVVTFPKERILISISEKYRKIKRELLHLYCKESNSEMDVIRKYSDYIIDEISDKIKEDIRLNCKEENITEEDLDYCIPIFLCYAFVECKILERP